jgi:hypothetical protein
MAAMAGHKCLNVDYYIYLEGFHENRETKTEKEESKTDSILLKHKNTLFLLCVLWCATRRFIYKLVKIRPG